MIKTKSTILLFILFFTFSISFAQNSDDLIGKYQLPNKLDVEIYKENGKYFGKIIYLRNFEDGQITDIHNPDKSKHNDSLIGMQIINGLEYDKEEKRWVNGKMYGPEKGMIFNLKVIEMRANEIVVVGSKYVFWKTLIWKKI